MGKLVAVKGCTLQLSSGTAKIETDPSQYVTIDGKAVYRGDITISVKGSAGDHGGNGNNDGQGSKTLSGSGKNMLVDGKPAVLEGDKVTVTVNGTTTSGTTTTPTSDTVVVTIQNAGQSNVSAP